MISRYDKEDTEEMFDMKVTYNKFMNKWTRYNQ